MHRAAKRVKPCSQGFTLVELMVVIAIVGMAAGAVVMSLPDPRPPLGVEAERVAARLRLAREEAVLTNRTVALTSDGLSYGFERLEGGQWQPLTGVLGDRSWGEGVKATLTARPVFDPTGGAEPSQVQLSREGYQVTVRLDGAGEMTIHE